MKPETLVLILINIISKKYSLEKPLKISYEIHPDFKGRGIATAAVSHCLAYTDANLDIHKIIAYTLTDNIASQRVAEKAGFVNKGVLKNNCMYNGKLIDRVILVYPE